MTFRGGVGLGVLFQGMPLHIFQHQVGWVGPLVHINQRHDVGVVDLPNQHGLVVQQTAVLACLHRIQQQVGVYLFDGNPVVPKGVTCQIHHTAGPASKLALDLVFADIGWGGRRHGAVRSDVLERFHHTTSLKKRE